MPDLPELAAAAIAEARSGEGVEAYAEESRRTQVDARRGEVEGLTFAEARGVGIRVVIDGRMGFAYAADPTPDEVRRTVERARENAALATEDEHNALPEAAAAAPIEGLYFPEQADMAPAEKVALALDMERVATTTDPAVTKVEACSFGDAVGRVWVASTTGMAAGFERTGCWCVVVTLAERDGDTQTGFSFQIAHRVADLDPHGVAEEAVERAARMLGATKPRTERVPVLLDPFAASSFLGVVADGLSAEAVQKGRSPFAELVGQQVGSEAITLVDDGRLLSGPSASPFDD